MRLILLLLAVLALSAPVQAQTLMTTTTLAANQSATDTVMSVTSATGFTVGNYVWVDSEQQLITAVNGTAISVRRGQNGTRAAAHDNAARIYTGSSDHFKTNDPDYGADCTRGEAQAAFLPWINVRDGVFWTCRAAGTSGANTWSGTSPALITYNSRPGPTF